MGLGAAVARGFGIEAKSAAPDPWPSWFTPPSTDDLIAAAGAGSIERAVGLPALLGVILRTGQGVGMMPVKVYELAADGSRQEATDTPQHRLLHRRPSSESTPSAFAADVAVSMAATGKAFVRKIKSRDGRVLELIAQDARQWKARRSAGRLVFDFRGSGGQTPPLDSSDMIYIRGLALNGDAEPLSPVAAHRLGITLVGLRRQTFERRFYDNDARPGVALVGPEDMTPDEASSWVDLWDERHAGADSAHRTAAIGGGFTVQTLPVSLVDAQFVEANQWTAAQCGAVYAMPKSFLNVGDNAPVDADWRFWTTFGLGWITAARDQAFNADPDLFPAGSNLFCETLTDALLKPDIKTRYEAYKAARQAGWMTSNEIRRLENLEPHPDGDVLQVIPVGGGEPSSAGSSDAKSVEAIAEALVAATSGHGDMLQKILDRAERQLLDAESRAADVAREIAEVQQPLVDAIGKLADFQPNVQVQVPRDSIRMSVHADVDPSELPAPVVHVAAPAANGKKRVRVVRNAEGRVDVLEVEDAEP